MKFSVQKQRLQNGLKAAQSIVNRKSTMPNLSNVLFRVRKDNELTISSTDLNIFNEEIVEIKNSVSGAIAVSSKGIYDIINNMPEGLINLERKDNNWLEITSGSIRYKLVGFSSQDFPSIPEHRDSEMTAISSEMFRSMIDKTLFSVCSDETRYHLNGVFFESDGTVARMVSTDGHRLSKVECSIDGGFNIADGVIIPKKGLIEIRRAIDSMSGTFGIAWASPYLFIQTSNTTLSVRLIDAKFPPYSNVIPSKHSREVSIEKEKLFSALRRAKVMLTDSKGVKFTVKKGQVLIAGTDPDTGEFNEEIEVDYKGDELTMGFNPSYVLEFLSQVEEPQITIELNEELDPCLIRPLDSQNYLGVVMPMRI